MAIVRSIRLRQWVVNLCRNAERIAAHRRATGLVFLIELIGCAVFPLPNALLMVGLVAAAPRKWLRFALGATAGDLVGGILLYTASRLFFQSYGERLIAYSGAADQWATVVSWFQSGWGIAFVLLACITTGLFRVASLGAGFAAMNPLLFVIVLTLSRGARWTAECAAIKYTREHARVWPKHYYKYAVVGAGLIAVAVLVFVTLKA